VSESTPVADGVDHQLDPRVIPLQRIGGALFFALPALGLLVFVVMADAGPVWVKLAVWLTFVALTQWHAYRWPPRACAHASYRVDEQGMEIRKGVHWRVVINVPR